MKITGAGNACGNGTKLKKSKQKEEKLLENEKNNYRKVSRNQNIALMNTENARNEPKQWETRLNGKLNNITRMGEKMRFYQIAKI